MAKSRMEKRRKLARKALKLQYKLKRNIIKTKHKIKKLDEKEPKVFKPGDDWWINWLLGGLIAGTIVCAIIIILMDIHTKTQLGWFN